MNGVHSQCALHTTQHKDPPPPQRECLGITKLAATCQQADFVGQSMHAATMVTSQRAGTKHTAQQVAADQHTSASHHSPTLPQRQPPHLAAPMLPMSHVPSLIKLNSQQNAANAQGSWVLAL
mmetsp:Transcript_8422/g.21024  ORF Transcript_8422/g.21024 Transcript_8422/m.21024 type:complete len:122 (-) Transcript_8422:1402-1767(-)